MRRLGRGCGGGRRSKLLIWTGLRKSKLRSSDCLPRNSVELHNGFWSAIRLDGMKSWMPTPLREGSIFCFKKRPEPKGAHESCHFGDPLTIVRGSVPGEWCRRADTEPRAASERVQRIRESVN